MSQTQRPAEGIVAEGEHSVSLIGRVAARMHMVGHYYATKAEAHQGWLKLSEEDRAWWIALARAAIVATDDVRAGRDWFREGESFPDHGVGELTQIGPWTR